MAKGKLCGLAQNSEAHRKSVGHTNEAVYVKLLQVQFDLTAAVLHNGRTSDSGHYTTVITRDDDWISL